jgi:magnesium chelatase subunit D
LSVQVKTISEIGLREQIIENRINFDDNPEKFVAEYSNIQNQLYLKIKEAKENIITVVVPKSNYKAAAALALKNQVEGHRADVLLIKTARAYAAYLGDKSVELHHLETIAPFVLNHRSNNNNQSDNNNDSSQNDQNQEDSESDLGNNAIFKSILPENTRKEWNKNKTVFSKGEETGKNSLSASLSEFKSIDNRKTVGQYLATNQFDIKHQHQNNKQQSHLIFLLDSSGSMLKDKVIAYAKGLVEKFSSSTLGGSTIYSLLSAYDGDAQLIHDSSKDVKALLNQLETLKTGGKTNVIPAFKNKTANQSI